MIKSMAYLRKAMPSQVSSKSNMWHHVERERNREDGFEGFHTIETEHSETNL